jgi:hypothetical protein
MDDIELLRIKDYDRCFSCKAQIILDKKIDSNKDHNVIPVIPARKKHHCRCKEEVLSEKNVIKETPRPIANAKQIRPIAQASSKHNDRKKQPVGKIDPVEEDLIVFDDDYMMTCPDRICSQCGNDHSFRNNFEGVKTSIDFIPELLSNKKVRVKEVLN